MSLKVQAGLNLATASILLAVATTMATGATWLAKRFSDMDTRIGKLESAIKALDSAQPDERYRQLVKELMAERERNVHACTPSWRCEPDAGASASSPAMVKPQ